MLPFDADLTESKKLMPESEWLQKSPEKESALLFPVLESPDANASAFLLAMADSTFAQNDLINDDSTETLADLVSAPIASGPFPNCFRIGFGTT